MKKLLFKNLILIICLMAILTACTNSKETINNYSGLEEGKSQFKDKTVKLDKTYIIPDEEKVEIKGTAVMDYVMDSNIKTIKDYSEYIIKGTVQNVEYTHFNGNAHVKVDVLVEESLMGDLQVNDIITLFHFGGYISIKDYEDYWGIQEKFGPMTEEEKETRFLNTSIDGEPIPKTGDTNIYFLVPANPASEMPNNTFERSRGPSSLFRIEEAGTVVSRINSDLTGENKVNSNARFSSTYGNESMSMNDFLKEIGEKNE